MTPNPRSVPRVRGDEAQQANAAYLTVLAEQRGFGAMHLHAGLARYSFGTALCNDQPMMEFRLALQDDRLALFRPAKFRHRCVEAWLELNRGCPRCLDILAKIGNEAGFGQVSGLDG